MARPIPEGRADELIRAATRVFISRGFRRTQMSHVANAVGVSAGSVYTYVEGKEALFFWCLRRAAGVTIGDAALPLSAPARDVMLKEVEQALDANARLPTLQRALRSDSRRAAPAAELQDLIGELYDATRETRVLQALIERSAMDIPGLADTFFLRVRRRVLRDLTKYLMEGSATGRLKHLPHPEVSARLILEAQSWFARTRYADPDAGDIDDTAARAVVIADLSHSFLP